MLLLHVRQRVKWTELDLVRYVATVYSNLSVIHHKAAKTKPRQCKKTAVGITLDSVIEDVFL